MNFIFLFFISSYTFACGKEISLEAIFLKNNGLPTYSHIETYIATLLTKAPLREKYCGEKLNSPACFQKLRKLDLPSLIKLQNGLHHDQLLIHEGSGQADIDEFVVKEFSNNESRTDFISEDPHRMPLIESQAGKIELLLNMVAVQCQQHFKSEKGELRLGKLLVNRVPDLIEFLRTKPLPVTDYKNAFEETAIFLGTPQRGAIFFGQCLENVEKSCELTPDLELCELKRTVKAAAWKYSEVTHQINYFEAIREDGHRLYGSTGEKILNRLVLQTPRFVMDFAAEFKADGVCKK